MISRVAYQPRPELSRLPETKTDDAGPIDHPDRHLPKGVLRKQVQVELVKAKVTAIRLKELEMQIQCLSRKMGLAMSEVKGGHAKSTNFTSVFGIVGILAVG